jgi:acetyl esterase/lipase
MAVACIAAFAVLAIGGLVACFPAFDPPLSGLSFSIGFLTGELAGQLFAITCGLGVAVGVLGWPRGPLGVAAALAAVVAVATYAALLWVGLRARHVVAECLGRTRGLGSVAVPAAGDRWLRWWRTCLAVPVGGRVTVTRDVPYEASSGRSHRLDVYVPRGGTSGAPVLVFVHGGAWVFGSKRGQGLVMLHELAARGWVCVTCNYRLSPKATWPDHVIDVKRALAWTKSHATEFGGDPARFLAIAGNSAGGHLAALTALSFDEPGWQPGFEDVDLRVDACVSLYGVLEMTGDRELAGRQGLATVMLLERTVMKASLSESREVYEAASPLHRVREDAPAFMVVHGTKDSLVPVSVARAFVGAFERGTTAPMAYVELPWAQHAFDLLCSPRSAATTRGIAAYLEGLVAAKSAQQLPRTTDPPRAAR